MAFGLEIKRLREEVPISAQKLADQIGVKAERMRKWEEKDSTPRVEDVQKIESFFGMTIAEVMKLKSIKKFLIVPHEKDGKGQNSSNNRAAGDRDLVKELRDLREWQAGVDATLTVLMAEFVPLIVKHSGKSQAGAFAQLRKDIEAETKNRIDAMNRR